MKSQPRETAWHVARICALWGAVAGSYNVMHICIPLMTRDADKQNAPQWLGWFMSINAVAGTAFSVLGGFFSDYMGRMAIMRPWAVFYFVCVVLVLVADALQSLPLVLVARTATISVPTTLLLAYFSDFLRGAALVESYGYLSGSFGVCNFIFTILCGVVNRLFSRMASLSLAVGLAAVALSLTLFSPPPRTVQAVMDERAAEKGDRWRKNSASGEELVRSLRVIAADRYLLLICIACSAVRLANMNDHLMLVYFIAYRTNADLSSVSYVLGVMALTMSTSQLVLLPMSLRWNCVFPVLLLALLSMSACVMGFSLCFELSHFYIAAFLLGLSLLAPSVFNARISALTSHTGTSGFTLGVVSTITNGAEIFAAVLYGHLLTWSTTTHEKTSVWSGVPLMVNGSTIALALVITLYAEVRYGKRFGHWGAENKHVDEAAEAALRAAVFTKDVELCSKAPMPLHTHGAELTAIAVHVREGGSVDKLEDRHN